MIRKAIHDHMILNDLSAQDVADRCGLSVNTVHNILSGKTQNPNIDTCAMIARGLGISLDFIAGLEFAQKIVEDPTPTEQMPPIAQPPIVPAPASCPQRDALIDLYERAIWHGITMLREGGLDISEHGDRLDFSSTPLSWW